MSTVDLLARGQSAREVLAWSRAIVDSALREAVDRLPSSMRRIAGYHFGWYDADGAPAGADAGKAMRPAFTLAAAEAVGGSAADAVPAAVAVELVHNFSLLHDDVMDGDVTRRHRPTAWSVFGQASAILAGDALLSLAYDVLTGCGHPAAPQAGRMLHAAVLELIDGQATDVAFEERDDVTLAECRIMAEGKTAALLGGACALGGLLGGADPDRVAGLRAFGTRLGLAFQYVDDLLGIWGDPAVTGKPVHSDLHSRKKSLVVVTALTSGTPAGRELDRLYRLDRALSEAEAVQAADLIEAAGARTAGRSAANELLADAMSALHTARPQPHGAAALHALARMATHRQR
ncbi:dimethylallyltransferase [Catellatospora sp. TT07R-123]|uniref:family 2 encapsulin nanocompartment cargo protein polyprenyl transferase n=1 Tax=Catellatospora sp. TT07R-123 TaxID=2733863 RepID=UPI001AFD344F|nr:family 2 encapsulin nanocompartment cargo protein polyprenyl transferase [Catellatospora sp. TT07R-123]GHJ48417.1 dimethylallyltransferase [Catellatospora sp. TT07R-123]